MSFQSIVFQTNLLIVLNRSIFWRSLTLTCRSLPLFLKLAFYYINTSHCSLAPIAWLCSFWKWPLIYIGCFNCRSNIIAISYSSDFPFVCYCRCIGSYLLEILLSCSALLCRNLNIICCDFSQPFPSSICSWLYNINLELLVRIFRAVPVVCLQLKCICFCTRTFTLVQSNNFRQIF